jgi:hypothetical protein
MKFIQIIIALFIFISFSACSTMDISHDYDTTYNFSELKTYKWHPKRREQKQVKHRLVAKQIDEIIENLMTVRGMTKSDDEEVDFYINYQAAIDGKLKAQNYSVSVGYVGYGGWMYGGSGTTITAYDEGTLVVDLIDAKNDELIFKGIAKVDMKEMKDDKVEMLDYILTEMFNGFPPQSE